MEKWELAYDDYVNGMKYKDIAEKHGVSVNTVKSWKSRKWNALDKGATKEKSVQPKKEVQPQKKEIELVIDNDNLTEQQKTFCLLYLQYRFNATKAYQHAYNADYQSARANGSRLLAKDNVKSEIKRLQAQLQQDTYATTKDLIEEYIKQAFADITDFTEFGTEEVPVKDEFGDPLLDEETGEPILHKSSYVRLKGSDEVDGLLIQEVKRGKDGVSIKLYDKQKAMDVLMKYFGADALREAQISKINKEVVKDETAEDKLSNYLEILGDVIDES